MIPSLETTLDKIRETAKGSDKERLNRMEIAVMQLKRRMARIEKTLWGDEE